MRVEVINTGTELLLGKVVNSHLSFFGDRLFKIGLRIERQISIPDGEAIRDALTESFGRADVVLVTGGLGPTSDDVTREVAAELLHRKLELDVTILDDIRELFRSRGYRMSATNERQAMVPEGAQVLPNPNGTAPGLYLPNVPGHSPHLFLLPGPPRELEPMFDDQVIPVLTELRGEETPKECWNFKIFGVGESAIADALDKKLSAIPGLELGYCARLGEVDVRCIGDEPALQAAAEAIEITYEREMVGRTEDTLEKVIVDRLTHTGETLATAESCTGGQIASTLTNIPGSSAVFHYGFVTYANEAKSRLLGVPESLLEEHGAVSEPVARSMAEGCLAASHADHAIAVSGIAGPDGGTKEKPVGTVYIAIASRNNSTFVKRYFFPQDRVSFKMRTTRMALDLLRQRLNGYELQ